MKKTAAITAAVLLAVCLLLSSCRINVVKEEGTAAEEKLPVISLSCETLTVAPGDTVRVYLHISDCDRFAVGSFVFSVAGKATLKGGDRADGCDVYAQANTDVPNTLVAGIFVATTIDFPDNDVYYIDISVPADAAQGDTFSVGLSAEEFETGLDEAGNELTDVTPSVENGEIIFTVG